MESEGVFRPSSPEKVPQLVNEILQPCYQTIDDFLPQPFEDVKT